MRINKRLVKLLVSKGRQYDSNKNYQEKEYVDVNYIAEGLFKIVAILFVSFLILLCTVPFARHMLRKPGPPPKVITKTVVVSEMSAAKREYIEQCKKVDDSYHVGIPDVHDRKWTCQVVKT